MSGQKILVYLLRRDLRLADNPIFTELSNLWSKSHAPFTAILPIYVFPAQQIEISGFLKHGESSPYPEARSEVGKYWRCGHHRAKFIAESVWDLKHDLEKAGSGLEIRAGMLGDVAKQLFDGFKNDEITAVWMTGEEGVEEKREERDVRKVVEGQGKEFKIWKDEKYYVDDADLPYSKPSKVPDVFSQFKNHVEPLRDAPRRSLTKPNKLPPLPSDTPPCGPFASPSSLEDTIASLHKPLPANLELKHPPKQPASSKATTAIPFEGGSAAGHKRLDHLMASGAMSRYKDTRNGLLGADFSSKLSAWLALGCITARQVHNEYLVPFEDGHEEKWKGAEGYGKGANKGTSAMRFELVWRDYFRLVTRKFGPRLFKETGFRDAKDIQWKYDQDTLKRWLEGTTGIGLVDASQRELFLTGYTSNRTRQNVASLLSKHLYMDWRLGAEWYETCLVDYDVSSNWGNWQYNSGVGNDPREGGMGRKFNPVKQGFDYDKGAEYVKSWVEEVENVEQPGQAFQYTPKEGPALIHIPFKGSGGGGSHDANGGRGGGGRGRGRGSGRQGFSKRDQ